MPMITIHLDGRFQTVDITSEVFARYISENRGLPRRGLAPRIGGTQGRTSSSSSNGLEIDAIRAARSDSNLDDPEGGEIVWRNTTRTAEIQAEARKTQEAAAKVARSKKDVENAKKNTKKIVSEFFDAFEE